MLGTEKDEKKETENFYGKIFNYFSTLKLKSELDQDVYYAYRVHVYWDGVSFNEKKKAELEKIINDKKSTLREITATKLWDDRWRVNVWCIERKQLECSMADSHHIPHSYFLRYNPDSKEITRCDPKIEKIY